MAMTREEKIKVLIYELTYPAEGEEFVLLCSMPAPHSVRALGTNGRDFVKRTVTTFSDMLKD